MGEGLRGERKAGLSGAMADFLELTKPRIVTMILVTTAIAWSIAAGDGASAWVLLHMLIGVGMVAGSAGAMNQVWEREIDSRMERTRLRPLPDGRLGWQVGATFAGLIGIAGSAYLWRMVGVVPAPPVQKEIGQARTNTPQARIQRPTVASTKVSVPLPPPQGRIVAMPDGLALDDRGGGEEQLGHQLARLGVGRLAVVAHLQQLDAVGDQAALQLGDARLQLARDRDGVLAILLRHGQGEGRLRLGREDGTNLDLSNSWGLAGHIGVDFQVSEKGAIRIDYRKIDIDTDVKLNGAKLGTKNTVNIDPSVYGIAYVMHF